MELKVWVEGIQRIVCGVTEKTTCQDVVYALAHATGKTGRFTLIERWRNNERLLAPHEHPLKVLMKWGEYSSDVHFILQRTAIEAAKGSVTANNNVNKSLTRSKPIDPLHGFTPPVSGSDAGRPLANSKDLKKSLTFSGGHHLDPSQSKESTPFSERKVTVGIVRGIPQQSQHQDPSHNGDSSLNSSFDHQEKSCINFSHGSELSPSRPYGEGTYPLVYPHYEPPYGRLNRPVNTNGGDSYSHLPVQYSTPPPPPPPPPPSSVQSADLNIRYPYYEHTRSSLSPGEEPTRAPPPYRNPPPPATVIGVRHVAPPPYREPPRPRGPSPYRASPGPSSNISPLPVAMATIANASPNRIDTRSSLSPGRSETVTDNSIRVCLEATQLRQVNTGHDGIDFAPVRNKPKRNQANEFGTQPPSPPSDPHHAHIIQLVNRQREKLDEQQHQLLQLDKDLNLWEVTLSQREEEESRMIRQEFIRLEEKHDENEEELAVLLQLEAQWETLRKEEEELTNELSQLNSNLSNTNAQLDRYSKAAKTLKENIQSEEERYLVSLEEELTRVKAQLEEANEKERLLSSEQEELAKNVLGSEETVHQLKEQIEQLTQEIKEANLQSLSIAPADDLKLLLEGSYKSGHSRRMLGSPRQLENAVPTNKNPHGVWV